MSRVYNFSAGPAMLPEEVLRQSSAEMLDYQGCGMSVMEMSHRSSSFQNILDQAQQDLKDLLALPDNYKVLFLQGGASQQFAMVPMNLMKNGVADYIVTGQWAKKAWAEGAKYGKVNKLATSEDRTFAYIPDCADLPVSPDADYVYICENNTIYGTKYKTLPNTKGKPLVADQSSCFLSEPVDRRSAEEHRPGGRGSGYHPGGSDPGGGPGFCAHHAAVQNPCGQQFFVQYTSLLRHLYLRKGVPVD